MGFYTDGLIANEIKLDLIPLKEDYIFEKMKQKCRTKCERVDFMLEGGICTGEVTEIFGESGVGKTQICLQMLLMCLLYPGDGGLYGSSIYIQACPVFPAQRLHSLSVHLCPSQNIDENLLSLVHVKKIDNVDQIFLVLNQVELMVINSHEGCRNTKVVVLYSIAYLFRHEHDNTYYGFMERKRMLQAVARKIKEIASKYNLVFIVVNEAIDVFDNNGSREALSTYSSGGEIKASLGSSWESLIRNKMFISHQYDINTKSWYRELTVLKSTNMSL
ncbi:DNA repair protein XRCC3 homolog [Chenopodium quinoa]|uniref:DNA repair protein XRCC3 homolog n=1 Tax=Chenopodium quinoa TaxID=63459 RepID=UPI000B771D83|nr:DNA repair protein XRCC3 homolog [Chenopodium quinoa]